ncbi:hypothetical protein BDY19DRAFT_991155 [Irpex rosettiformis]|uniref:Uncharacterized protein n=1 Tax=Irpex rosettiformis TaxID=378272 RepID=A0ACB8UBK4_9APHY|nr:hypothetical protein BDY19DRAFT_991155 [Irpex rosettiformis]
MATGPPTGGPGPLQTLDPSPPPTSWDGDRMFNIYIYDYCLKRGYTSTARELIKEAEIPQDSAPPINAKQGLLFEWWSVFWVLFTAKSSGNGPEEALLYTQAQQTNQRQAPRPPPQVTPRFMGAVNGPRAVGPQPPMPNGVSSTAAQPGQQSMPNGTQGGSFGPGPQPNGIAGPSHPTGPSIGTPAMMQGQRPGAAPPQRGPNGMQFQSPTIAHSPQHSGAGHPGPQQPQMNANIGPQGSMQLRGTMPPPGPQGLMGNPQQSAPAFQPLPGSSASHPNSPAAHGVNQSPSFANRQPQMPPGTNLNQSRDSAVNTDFLKIESVRLNALKDELGLGNIDVPSLTTEDKTRIVVLARERGAIRDTQPKPGPLHNVQPGAQNRMPPVLQPGQQRQLGAPFAQQGLNQQRIKRNSTSPGDETEQSQNDSSPPANKRLRTSPTGADQQPPMAGLGFPPQSSMHAGPGNPPHPQNVMMPMMPGANGSFASGPRMGNPSMAGSHIAGPIVQYRQSMSALHKNHIPPGAPNMMTTSAPSPAAADSPFDGSSRPGNNQFPGNRPPQQQSKPSTMMPPPSPGAKKEPEPGTIPSVHSSPHNLPAQQPPLQQAPGPAPSASVQNPATIAAPSPTSNMNNNQAPGGQLGPQSQANNQPQLPPPPAPPANNSNELFMSNDFMQQLGGIPGFEFTDFPLAQVDQMGGGGEFDLGEWFHSDI